MHRRKIHSKEDEIPLISKNREEQEERDELLQTKRLKLLGKKTERRERQARTNAKETTKNLSKFLGFNL
jgi:hypothetical protein